MVIITPGGGGKAYASTHWSVVVRSKDPNSPGFRWALERLIVIYWRPVYWHFRRQGAPANVAQERTKEFFAWVMTTEALKSAGDALSKFRTYIGQSLPAFVPKGGKGKDLPVEWSEADLEFAVVAKSTFDASWGHVVYKRALTRLEIEMRSTKRKAWWEAFDKQLQGGSTVDSTVLAKETGAAEAEVNEFIEATRKRFKQNLEEEVRQYVTTEEEIAQEMKALFASFAG